MITRILIPITVGSASASFLPQAWSDFKFWGQSGTAWFWACILIAAGFFLRKPLAGLFSRLLSWVRWRGRPVGQQAGRLIGPIVSWLVPLICVYFAALQVLSPAPEIAAFISRVTEIWGIVILLMLADVVIQGIFFLMGHAGRKVVTPTVQRFYLQIIRVFLVILGVIMVFSLLGLNVGGIITGLGVGGLAVSLAAKETLTNLLAGITIMTDHLFEIGDLIRTSDLEGTVEYIGFRTSRVRDYDQTLICVPNAKLTENYVYNLTKTNKRRLRLIVNLPITISSGQIRELCDHLQAEIGRRPDLSGDPAVTVLDSIQADVVQLLVQYFLTDLDLARLREEKDFVLQNVWQYLDSYKLQIPETLIHLAKRDS